MAARSTAPTADGAGASEPRGGASEPMEEVPSGHDEFADGEQSEEPDVETFQGDVNKWLPAVLGMLAKTQRELVRKATSGGDYEKKRSLAAVKIEDFYGD